MRFYIPLLVISILGACQKPIWHDGRPVILTENDQLASHVGEIVTVQGVVSSSSVPQIIGVDISLDDPEMAGSYAQATGVLYHWMITPEAHAAMLALNEMIEVRGPGTYFSLVSPAHLSPASPVIDSPAGPMGSIPPDGMDPVITGVEIDIQQVDERDQDDLMID